MAFALTRFKAYGRRHEGENRSHAEQVCEFHVTAAATDYVYDLDVTAGTFWTSAELHATYGTLATAAKAIFLTNMAAVVHRCIAVQGEPLVSPYLLVASGATGLQYTAAIGTVVPHYPSLAFVSASAPLAITLVITFTLVDGIEPLTADLGAAVTN